MTQVVRMVRMLSVAVMVCGLVAAFLPALGLAQEAGAAAPSIMDTVLAVLRAVLPTMVSFVGPYITKGIGSLIGGLSPTVGATISTVLGSLLAAATAGLEGLPEDGYAAVGAGAGLTGHAVLQTKPIAPTAAS